MGRFRWRLLRAPLLVKILVANGAVVALGAAAGTALTAEHVRRSPDAQSYGLMVLFADDNKRADLRFYSEFTETMKEKARKYNRWFRISGLRRYEDEIQGRMYEFIAVYEDGSRVIFRVTHDQGWYVNFKSMDLLEPPRREVEVARSLRRLLDVQHKATLRGEGVSRKTLQYAGSVAFEITLLFPEA